MADSKAAVTKVIKDGIETSYENAGEDWRKYTNRKLEELVRKNQYITSDMLIAHLEEDGYGLSNYSALGGVFTRAAKNGLIVKTGNHQLSTRTKSHSAKTVWRSLIYGKADATTKETNAISLMIVNALEFNAATVRYASMVYGVYYKLKKDRKQKIINDFEDMADKYVAKNASIVESLEKEIEAAK